MEILAAEHLHFMQATIPKTILTGLETRLQILACIPTVPVTGLFSTIFYSQLLRKRKSKPDVYLMTLFVLFQIVPSGSDIILIKRYSFGKDQLLTALFNETI